MNKKKKLKCKRLSLKRNKKLIEKNKYYKKKRSPKKI